MSYQTAEKLNARCDAACQVADIVSAYLINLQSATGLPATVLLAGAHAALVAAMTAALGGPIAAHACDSAAARVRNLPSVAACSLAFAAPTGRA